MIQTAGVHEAHRGKESDLAHLTAISETCIHCGLCLEECPTYLELGNEVDSPRGRIFLMRSVAEGEMLLTAVVERHLALCLGCRACEAACPSGVRYGELLERTRATMRNAATSHGRSLTVLRLAGSGPGTNEMQAAAAAEQASYAPRSRTFGDWLLDFVVYRITPSASRLRWAIRMGRIGALLGVNSLVTRLFPKLEKVMAMLPRSAGAAARLPRFSPPTGALRAHVQFFAGCATTALTPTTVNRAQAVLRHNGCAVHCPRAQGCCGAIHMHGGRINEAKRLARENVRAFAAAGANADRGAAPQTPIVSIAAGCSAMLRSYGELLQDDPALAAAARDFAARVRDISEFLVEIGPVRPTREVRRRVTMHDACHLVHVQGVRAQPRALLAMIPGLELVEAREAQVCCGAAGSYNLTEPQTAARLGKRKLANLRATGASCAAAGNIGCIMHLNALAKEDLVVHTIDVLHEAYGLGDG